MTEGSWRKCSPGPQDDYIFPQNSVHPKEDAKTEDGYLIGQAQQNSAREIEACEATLESLSELFLETSFEPPNQEELKNDSLNCKGPSSETEEPEGLKDDNLSCKDPSPITTPAKHPAKRSDIATITRVTLLPLLALELYLIYQAYTEWASWYN